MNSAISHKPPANSSPSPSPNAAQNGSRRSVRLAQVAAWLAALLFVLRDEIGRINELRAAGAPLIDWLTDINIDSTLFLPLLVVAPVVYRIRRPWLSWQVVKPTSAAGDSAGLLELPRGSRRAAALCAALVAATSLAVSWSIGREFGDWPPAYHDEFSYLFQAETFLHGRTSFPSDTRAPEIFNQVHVLNEGKFASRYFPGAGLWIAPFLKLGHPYWGHWLAGALTAAFLFYAGRELGGLFTGLCAGMLTALSPGMGLFGNLLLAHHPGLVGLSLFLFAFLRFMRTRSLGDGLLAGIGLAFGMLCRPMTAAGWGLPFGLWLLYDFARGTAPLRTRIAGVAAIGLPVVVGIIAMAAYNQSITGSPLVSPYQLYTDIYTPRHVYGFYNVTRGEQHLGPKVIDNYDRWAVELTPILAAKNVGFRLLASWNWTLGLLPLGMATIVFLMAVPQTDRRWWLVFASIASLHAVHVPYWFDGIMHWHYVFETGPLWLLVTAGSLSVLRRYWRETQRAGMPVWTMAFLLATLLPTFAPLPPFWPSSRLQEGISELSFARKRHADVRDGIASLVSRPALVLIEHDPADRHMDYVSNSPDLSDDILYARALPERYSSAEIARRFPERNCYEFRVLDGRLKQVSRASETPSAPR